MEKKRREGGRGVEEKTGEGDEVAGEGEGTAREAERTR
jgi:hypothetical protein